MVCTQELRKELLSLGWPLAICLAPRGWVQLGHEAGGSKLCALCLVYISHDHVVTLQVVYPHPCSCPKMVHPGQRSSLGMVCPHSIAAPHGLFMAVELFQDSLSMVLMAVPPVACAVLCCPGLDKKNL